MSYSIEMLGYQELQALWAQTPDIVRQELLSAMTEADLLVERNVKERTPVGASAGGAGGLKGSIFGEESVGPEGVLGVVATAMPYAIPVELGTRPHFPPVEPLVDWVVAKLGIPEKEAHGVAFAIARKIARVGTKGHGMFHAGFEEARPQVIAMFERARDRIVARLSPGGAA